MMRSRLQWTSGSRERLTRRSCDTSSRNRMVSAVSVVHVDDRRADRCQRCKESDGQDRSREHTCEKTRPRWNSLTISSCSRADDRQVFGRDANQSSLMPHCGSCQFQGMNLGTKSDAAPAIGRGSTSRHRLHDYRGFPSSRWLPDLAWRARLPVSSSCHPSR